MEAFKESGGIDFCCDVMIGLQLEGAGEKDFNVDEAKAAIPRKIEAVVLKNRSGKSGETLKFEYDSRFNLFRDVMQGHKYSKEDAPRGNLSGVKF